MNGGVSELYVNGQKAGVRWYGQAIYPVAELLKKGENKIDLSKLEWNNQKQGENGYIQKQREKWGNINNKMKIKTKFKAKKKVEKTEWQREF